MDIKVTMVLGKADDRYMKYESPINSIKEQWLTLLVLESAHLSSNFPLCFCNVLKQHSSDVSSFQDGVVKLATSQVF